MSGEPAAAPEQQQRDDQPSAEDLAAFNAGFKLTAEPETIAPRQGGEETASKEPVATPMPTPVPTPAPPPEPKNVTISEADWQEVRTKAQAFDDHTRQINTLSGNLGGLKQQVEKLQARGVTKVTAESLKRLAAEYPDLAGAIAEDLSSILSAPSGTTLEPEEVERRANELLTTEFTTKVNALERKLLKVAHPDWVEVLRSAEFKAYQQTLPPADNAKLMESVDGELVADHITAFKARKAAEKPKDQPKPAATPAPTGAPRKTSPRQELLEAAAPAKGQGAGAETPDPVDDFNAGWKLKGAA